MLVVRVIGRVLVVDDDIDILEALAAALADNHRVSTAVNGAEALALLLQEPFDALVLDLMMPVMDGETLIERMRAHGLEVPVLLSSASHDIAVVASRLGVVYITKPYDAASIEKKLALLLQARAAETL